MALTFEVDPNITAMLRSIGLLDADGRIDSSWFQNPIAGVRRILADPVQRAALLELLEELLPADAAAPEGSEWVPLLDTSGRGNVYLTVEGDVIGVAAALSTADDASPRASAGVRLPLVDTAGELRPIAATSEGPLELAVDLEFEPPDPVAALRLRASVDIEGHAALRFVLDGVDLGSGPETIEVSTDDFGRDLVRAVEVLVRDALGAAPGGDLVADHLLGALGLDGVLPPLPLEELARDPAAFRSWLAQIAGSEADLEAWFGHVTGLLGADPPAAADPLAARLVDIGGVADLVLRAEVAGGELVLTLAVVIPEDAARLEASAALVAIPLAGVLPVRLVPRAAVRVRAPGGAAPLVDAAPTVRVGSLSAGVVFDGVGLVPELLARDVVLETVTYETLDLTDANAVVGAATAGVRAAIETALGDTGPGRALLVLLGILPPASDAAWPPEHLIDVAGLARGPTAAIAEVHRAVLGDTAHPWSHMLRELGNLLDLGAGAPDGSGTIDDPWRVEIASAGEISLDLAAWNARDASTPAGEERLRIGLQVTASAALAPWEPRLLSELLAFDLPASGAAAVRVIGEQRLEIALDPVPDAPTAAGITVRAAALRGLLTWRPGLSPELTARAEQLRVSANGDEVGPVTLVFPPADPSAPDLGLGVGVDDLLALLRLLARHATRTWAGDGAVAVGDLLGLFGDGPLIEPPDPADLGSLFARPGDALRTYLRALALELDADGEPNAERALAKLAALLRDQVPRAADGFAARLDVEVGGSGSYEGPWTLPLTDLAGERTELLVWLDPAGPPADWAAALVTRLSGVADGRTLAALAPRVAAFAPGLPPWLAPELHGDALDALGAWLADGDGASPLDSQLPDLPGWRHGELLDTPHAAQPRDPRAIAQIAAQLDDWAEANGSRAVLLVGPPWSDRAIWDDLLAAVEPGRPAGAHFDLRGGASPAAVTAVARHYTADLDDDGTGDLAGLSAQIGGVLDRIVALSGRAQVAIVAHSTAGVAARVLAGARPDVVRGIVTVGTPHAGDAPLPLTDPGLAEALRAARAIAGDAAAGEVAGAALDALDAGLDGVAGALAPGGFVRAPDGTPGFAPGLALGSALGGDLVTWLGELLGARARAAAAARPADSAPTHVGVGARMRLPLPAAAAGEPELDATVRLDAGRIRLVDGAAEPSRPAQAAHLHAEAGRPGGWLVGDAVGASPRIRSAELVVRLVPAPGGGVGVEPRLVLRDVVRDGRRRDLELGDEGLAPALELVAVALGDAAARADLGALTALAESPAAFLHERRDAVLDALEDELGGALGVPLASLPLELTLDRATWGLRLRSTADLALGEGVGASFDAGLALTTLTPQLSSQLRVGAVSLEYATAAGALTLAAEPWLDRLVVAPAPSPDELRARLVPVVPRVALSVALSAVLGEMLQVRGSVGALDRLLADPGAALRRLAAGDVQELLQSAARALGVDDADGLLLPGDIRLRASGADPLRLELSGALDLGAAGDELRVALALDFHSNRTVSPAGTLTVDVGLPGDWGRIEVEFGASAAGPELVVTPEGAQPIRLLPQFSGFGALLAAGTTSLLPRLLQALVDELRPAAGPPAGLLGTVLDLATELGIYADDAQGFEEPQRAARLAAMLQPGWIEAQIADPAAIAQLIDAVCDAIPLPVGVVDNVADRLTWTAPLPGAVGGEVVAAVKLGAPQELTVTVTDLDAGPLVVELASLGFDGELAFALALRLDAGGELAFLAPVAELGVADGRPSCALLPLGGTRRADLELELAPSPGVTFTEAGALALIVEWGLPLVSLLGLRAAESVLDDALWTGGPSARDVVEGAGLVVPASSPPELVAPLPALESIALGALLALAEGIPPVPVTDTLDVGIVDDGTGRKGLRLSGHELITSSDIDVDLRFGEAEWLDPAEGGVTLWVLRPAQGMPPVALDLGLDLIGIGATFSGAGDEALIEGPVTVGGIGALAFVELDFLDAAGEPALSAAGYGGALELADTMITIAASEGDSFIQKLLPPELQAPFSLGIEAREGRGVQLHGGIGGTPGQIELTFPLDLDIGGIVRISEIYVVAGRDDGTIFVLAAISGGAALGPVAVAVERVGLRARFPSSGVQFGFKPPDGLGLSIATPALRLGGFLLVDEANGRYVGAVEIAIVEKFSLTAIGIITTRPFSLLFLISITFPVGIPLGYGFFFSGAGGLLGLNRGVDLDRLRIGLRSGTADSILFPTDIVRRIDTIVRDLEESFPVQEGRFLVGPMALITWSNPALISVKIGLIIEIGAPLRLAILGVLRLALPTPDAAVVNLQVAFLGAIDIPGSMLSFDASIFDSYLGYDDFKLSLEGDMALRICWGPQPDFVTSVGGFHPSFHPGAHLRLPPLRRMSISLLKDNPRITLSSYFAITSNTVQFGARLELVLRAGGFSIEGEAGLDVLVQIVPVRLEAMIYARLAVKSGDSELLTISLEASIEGPTPWIARGKAKFKILFFSVSVRLEVRQGQEAPAELPLAAVLPPVLDALRDDAAWTATLGEGANELVQLLPPPEGTLIVDAAGMLTVSQRLVPLDTDFSLFGVARATDASRISVRELRVGDEVPETLPVTDAFAPAAFRPLSDQEKLSAPAFEQRPAGVQSLSGERLTTDSLLPHPVVYETLTFDSAASSTPAAGQAEPSQDDFEALVGGGAIGTSALSLARARRDERGKVHDVGSAGERYAVARVGDLTPLDATGAAAAPGDEGVLVQLTEAQERRKALIAAGVAGDLQILPEAQLAA